MTRVLLLLAASLQLSGCAMKIVKASNPSVSAEEVPNAAFLGVANATGSGGSMKDMVMITGTTGEFGTVTSTNYKAFTGDLDVREVANLGGRLLVPKVVPESLVGVTGNDVGLTGMKAAAESYPEFDCFVVIQLSEASWRPDKYTRRTMQAAYIGGATLGLAAPFLAPWVNSEMDIPISVEGTVRVFDARSGRFEVNDGFRAKGKMVVKGMNWTMANGEELLETANRTGGKMLAAAVDDKIACAVPTPPMKDAPVDSEAADDEGGGSEAAEE